MLEIGQKLYLYQMDSRHRNRAPHEVTVQSIGRKWAVIDHGRRINKDTLWIDAGQYTSDERCYLSPEQRQNELDLGRAWDQFRDRVARSFQAPTSNIEAIRQAAELLGFNQQEARK